MNISKIKTIHFESHIPSDGRKIQEFIVFLVFLFDFCSIIFQTGIESGMWRRGEKYTFPKKSWWMSKQINGDFLEMCLIGNFYQIGTKEFRFDWWFPLERNCCLCSVQQMLPLNCRCVCVRSNRSEKWIGDGPQVSISFSSTSFNTSF